MEKIAVLGLGKVGALAAQLLVDSGFTVVGVDMHAKPDNHSHDVSNIDVTDAASLGALFADMDAVLSCLPYHLNIGVSDVAHAAGIHYFDLTEDVPTTNHVRKLAETSKGLMAPQCGLAPGFVGIVGADLIAKFDECRSCRMRVGALPQNPTGLMGYAFNGLELEAFTTSGGLGTMCETYLGQVHNMDYKTMRYPGHFDLMNFFFHELLMREDREKAGEILVNAKPPVDQDVVYVHVAAEGTIDGKLSRKEFVGAYKPLDIAGKSRTAIAWTTAGSVVAVIEMVKSGKLPSSGFLKQEDIPLDALLQTRPGSVYTR